MPIHYFAHKLKDSLPLYRCDLRIAMLACLALSVCLTAQAVNLNVDAGSLLRQSEQDITSQKQTPKTQATRGWDEATQLLLLMLAAEMPGTFDVVTCMEMLEHVPDPSSIVRACAQLVKPGGYVFFSTLNRNAKSFLFAIVGAEYVLNMLPRGTHEYAKFIRPSELARDCREAGLEWQHTRGMEYNPLTRRYWLSNDTSVNYLVATQRPL